MIIEMPYQPSSRARSWITFDQIDKEYPEFINKLADVLFNDIYPDRSKDYVRGIIEFLQDWDFLSWKQFDSVLKICRTYHEYQSKLKYGTFYGNIGVKWVIMRNGSTVIHDNYHTVNTDREMDELSIRLFGERTVYPEELDGMEIDYTRDGRRVFLLPNY